MNRVFTIQGTSPCSLCLRGFLSRRSRWPLPAFLLAALVLRSVSFFRSVVDWDESLYLLVARSMLEGHLPYTEIWNNTPPGIYVVFASVLLLFPDSILAVRLFTCVVVGLTAFLIHCLAKALGARQSVSLLAGTAYVLHASSPALGGLASNTELFFNLAAAAAFLLLATGRGARRRFAAGLLFGVGFQIKYHVAFDFAAGLAVTAWLLPGGVSRGVRAAARRWGPMVLGFALPTAGVLIAFLLAGHLREYVDSAILANVAYVGGHTSPATRGLVALKDQFLAHPFLWLSVPYAVLGMVRERTGRTSHLLSRRPGGHPDGVQVALANGGLDGEPAAGLSRESFALAWLAASFLATLATRRYWDHYFLQLLPSMCLLGAWAAGDVLRCCTTGVEKVFFLVVVLLATGMVDPIRANLNAAIRSARHYVERTDGWKDTPLCIAEYLVARMEPGDIFYVVDDQPVIYFLAHARLPTRYPFPHHLVNPDLNAMTNVDPVTELGAIVQQGPRYVVRRRDPEHAPSPFYAALEEHLAAAYVYETTFHDPDRCVDVDLYRLASAPP